MASTPQFIKPLGRYNAVPEGNRLELQQVNTLPAPHATPQTKGIIHATTRPEAPIGDVYWQPWGALTKHNPYPPSANMLMMEDLSRGLTGHPELEHYNSPGFLNLRADNPKIANVVESIDWRKRRAWEGKVFDRVFPSQTPRGSEHIGRKVHGAKRVGQARKVDPHRTVHAPNVDIHVHEEGAEPGITRENYLLSLNRDIVRGGDGTPTRTQPPVGHGIAGRTQGMHRPDLRTLRRRVVAHGDRVIGRPGPKLRV